ncbi:hypothetical protein [Haloplanus salilacus]|uniref:hypothetical protein n=1 Tax=Haloplanus salilacus TaxID=2949994 RepID=UPI0030CC4A58
MAGAEAGVVLLVFAVGIGASLLLYALVRAEHDEREVMDREAAERTARRDVDDGDRR